ncbi:MAG: hypothetical protein FJ294_12200 [Planctomycetes bacterium]|nr:hypothetical protein [Planctomycetota bacterium]
MLLSILSLAVLALSGSDRVELKDGKVHEGRVLAELKGSIVLREGKQVRSFSRADVANVTSLERSLAPLLEHDLKSADAAALATWAAEADRAGLTADARNLWLRTLLADKDHEGARKALGAKPVKDDVALHFGKSLLHLAHLRAGGLKWKYAYELPTTHFVLKTDLPLPAALEAATALERFHHRFYGLLGEPLELYVFDERALPEVRIYAEGASYPTPPRSGDRVWFSMGENCLNVAADGQLALPALVSELSRQMLFSALRRSSGPTAQVQPWVSAGIAEYFGRIAPTQLGGAWGDASAAFAVAAKTVAASKTTFAALFNSPMNEFSNSPQAGEMSAAAWSALHFFLYARDGALREGFGRYVNDGAKGKLSMSALCEHVKLKPDEIESGWRAHVSAAAR